MLDPARVTVIIPSISITTGIERDLLKNGVRIGSDDFLDDLDSILDGEDSSLDREIKNLVRDKFIREYSKNCALFSGNDVEREIVIEIRDDLGDPKPRTLASFDFGKSDRTGQVHFTVSSHLVYSEFLEANQKESRDYCLRDEGYWSHELVHLLDWEYLTKASRLLEQTRSRYPITSLYKKDYTPGELQSIVLSSLAVFRDEGLAVLYEYLCGERELLSSGIENAVTVFQNDFYSLADMVLKAAGATSSNSYETDREISDICKRMDNAAYCIGPFWVADGLFYLAQEGGAPLSEGIVKNIMHIVECMKSGRPTEIGREDAADIINAGLKLDLGSYLDLVTRQDMEHPWGLFLNMDDLAYIFNLLAAKDSGRPIRLISNLKQAANDLDLELFIGTLTDIIGRMVMTDDELAEEFKQWKDGKTGESPLDKELVKHAGTLMAALGRSDRGRDIAALALTYLFDPEDYIDDEVAFMGTMDDLYVLRTACALVECG